MNHTQLINIIAKKIKAETYLEIGIGNGKNFDAIKCKEKSSVDPDPKSNAVHKTTSDEFFNVFNKVTEKGWKDIGEIEFYYDLIFIDGLHHADHVRRDIINAWGCLTDGGVLVIHDTNPEREDMTHVPRDCKVWTGDCYKAIHQIDGPPKFTLKDDHGVTVIRKTGPLVMSEGVIEWDGFELMREAILHLVTAEEAIKIINGWE